jgi:hypothetical protein
MSGVQSTSDLATEDKKPQPGKEAFKIERFGK